MWQYTGCFQETLNQYTYISTHFIYIIIYKVDNPQIQQSEKFKICEIVMKI